MASYWIVVPRGNADLFDLISIAFQGRSGFTVIIDRRADVSAAGRVESAERRGQRAELGPDEIVVAEQADQAARADRSPSGPQPRRSVPVIRSRPRGRVRRYAPGSARGPHAARASVPLPSAQ
jgi:hypothetical protein